MKRFLVVGLMVVLTACGNQHAVDKTVLKTYVVHPNVLHKTLFFTGTVQPLSKRTITSPMDAVVTSMHYHFGERVKAGDVLFTLQSETLQKQYNDTLTEYLKAKDNDTVARAKFSGSQSLWDAGLLSKNNYLSEQSGVNTARIALMQATRNLSDLLEKMGEVNDQAISTLRIADFNKVRLALERQHNQINIRASNAGVLLYPPKSSGDDQLAMMSVGTAVKTGDVLTLVGDLTGITLEIDVPEVDIDKIKLGMDASVHGVAFGENTLHGKLVMINAQASTHGGGGLPSFTALVEVKPLSEKEQEWIKMGMSASIEIPVSSVNKLLIPIASLQQTQDGHYFVNLRDVKGAIAPRSVVTGTVEGSQVVIESGLQAGNVIVYKEKLS